MGGIGENSFLGDIAVGIDLLERLKLEDGIGFPIFSGMNLTDFEILLQMVGEKIWNNQTVLRDTVPASNRLTVIFRFLTSGDSYQLNVYLSNFKTSYLKYSSRSHGGPNYFSKRICKGKVE